MDTVNYIQKSKGLLHLNLGYQESFISRELADQVLQECNDLEWKNLKRRTTFSFTDPGLVYSVTISGKTIYKTPHGWDSMSSLPLLKKMLEKKTGLKFNFCCVMRYPNGDVVIKKHRDKEMSNASVCGISVGATRTILFSPPYYVKSEPISIDLNHGSLYMMKKPTNDHWTHEITPNKGASVRYSLTFRNVLNPVRVEDVPILSRCKAILISGKRKGQECGNKIHDPKNKTCRRHLNTKPTN